MKEKQQELIRDILNRVINCYYEDGTLPDNYYNDLILYELTKDELELLKQF